jgi:hypothetical protein
MGILSENLGQKPFQTLFRNVFSAAQNIGKLDMDTLRKVERIQKETYLLCAVKHLTQIFSYQKLTLKISNDRMN